MSQKFSQNSEEIDECLKKQTLKINPRNQLHMNRKAREAVTQENNF